MTRFLLLVLPWVLTAVLRAETVTVYPDWFAGAQFSGL